MFLGRPLKFATDSYEKNKDEKDLYGSVPQVIVDEEDENLREWNKITDIVRICYIVNALSNFFLYRFLNYYYNNTTKLKLLF